MLTSQQGRSGYQLSKSAQEISLLDIYYATQEVQEITLFQMHQNVNRDCPVGKNIQGAMSSIFSSLEKDLERKLSQEILDDIITNLYQQAKKGRN